MTNLNNGYGAAPTPILFTKPGCQKCDFVKGKLPDGHNINIMDMTTPDGMAHGAYYEILEKHAPILVIENGHGVEVVEGAIKIKNKVLGLATCGGRS